MVLTPCNAVGGMLLRTGGVLERHVAIGLANSGPAHQEGGAVNKRQLDQDVEARLGATKKGGTKLLVGEEPSDVVGKDVLQDAECHQAEDGVPAPRLVVLGGHGVHVEQRIAKPGSSLGGAAADVDLEFGIAGARVVTEGELDHAPPQILTLLSWMAIRLVQPQGDAAAKFVQEQDGKVGREEALHQP